MDDPPQGDLGLQGGVSSEHSFQSSICHCMASLNISILMWRIRSCRCEADSVELTQFLDFSVVKLISPVSHQILGRTVVLDPLNDKMLCDGGGLFVLDEDARLEPSEGVDEVHDVRRSIFKPFVFFQVHSQDVIEVC